MDIQQEKRKQDPHMMISQITPRVMHLSSKLLNSQIKNVNQQNSAQTFGK
jgi:hypothetical protein